MRRRLSNELAEVINEFGPKVFEDFDEVNYSMSCDQYVTLTNR